MTQEESAVVNFLQSSPEAFFARKEIARRAMKRKTYEENPRWADAPLSSLLAQRIVEQNDSGQFRLRRSDAFNR